MATLNGIDLGEILTEQHRLTADLEVDGYDDSSSKIVADNVNTERSIAISGSYVGTLTEIRNFITNIENIINNPPQTGVSYVSDMTGKTYTVYIKAFDYNMTSDGGFVLSYNLDLVEGA